MHFAQATTMCIAMDRHNLTLVTKHGTSRLERSGVDLLFFNLATDPNESVALSFVIPSVPGFPVRGIREGGVCGFL
jgi:hypothetical protein